MGSAQGWSKERRREEIQRILRHLSETYELTATETNVLLANRLGIGLNTVQGWSSGGQTRDPPAWHVLDLLNYELQLKPVRPLVHPKKPPRYRDR